MGQKNTRMMLAVLSVIHMIYSLGLSRVVAFRHQPQNPGLRESMGLATSHWAKSTQQAAILRVYFSSEVWRVLHKM